MKITPAASKGITLYRAASQACRVLLIPHLAKQRGRSLERSVESNLSYISGVNLSSSEYGAKTVGNEPIDDVPKAENQPLF